MRLILSLQELSQRIGNPAGKHWINHLQWNTDGTRFVMLHRYGDPKAKGVWWTTRMLTADADGQNLYELGAQGMVSHFDWRDAHHLLAWARRDDENRFFLYRDQTDEAEIVADGLLKVDGHCSYSPDRKWLMSDEYPDKQGNRALFLFEPATQRLEEAGRFYGPFPSDHETRTDLHARWNRDGSQICIDSIHEGPRAMYVLDVPPELRQTR